MYESMRLGPGVAQLGNFDHCYGKYGKGQGRGQSGSLDKLAQKKYALGQFLKFTLLFSDDASSIREDSMLVELHVQNWGCILFCMGSCSG